MTVVYLTNLSIEKNGQNENEEDIQWLLDEGYRIQRDVAYYKDDKSVYNLYSTENSQKK